MCWHYVDLNSFPPPFSLPFTYSFLQVLHQGKILTHPLLCFGKYLESVLKSLLRWYWSRKNPVSVWILYVERAKDLTHTWHKKWLANWSSMARDSSEGSNWSALHLPLGKWKMMTIDTSGFECHPVLLTVWQGARPDPLLPKVFDPLLGPGQRQLSFYPCPVLRETIWFLSSGLPFLPWQSVTCQKNRNLKHPLPLLFVLATADAGPFLWQ